MSSRVDALLNQLQRALQLDVRFYGQTFLRLSAGHVSGVLRGIATTYLMALWLAPEVLGQFRYILALFGVAGIFSLVGMNTAVIRAVAQGDTVVVRVALKRMLQFAPLGSVLLFSLGIFTWWRGEQSIAIGFVIASIAFFPYTACGLYGAILTGKERIAELTRIAIINNLLYAVVFISVLWFQRSLAVITAVYFGFDILFRGFLTWRELRRLPDEGSLGTHLSLGKHLSVISVFQTIAAQLDHILIQRFGGYTTLANYSVIILIPEQIKNIVNSIMGTVLQRLSRHQKTEGHLRTTRRHFWVAVGGASGIVVAYAIIAPFALPILFPQYTGIVLPSILYAIGLVSLSSSVGVYFFQAHQEIKRLWQFYTVITLMQYAGNALLIPTFGVWGAVASRTLTRFTGMPFSYPALSDVTEQGKRRDE